MSDCLFCKIINGEIPSEKVYEDADVFAFLDIHPVNPGHVLVVPKKHVADAVASDDATLGAVMSAARKLSAAVMRATGASGFNMEINNGVSAGQVVFHLHLHIVPRFINDGLKHWPGKEYASGEAAAVAHKIKTALSA